MAAKMGTLSGPEAAKLRLDLQRAHEHAKSGRPVEAEAAYEQMLERLPGHPAVLQGLGLLKHSQGKHEQALQMLRDAVSHAPRAAELRCNLAAVLGLLGRHSDAAVELRQALRSQPDHAEAWSNLGVALEKMQEFDEAISAYRRALELKPRYANTWKFLGNAYRRAKRWSEAEAAYRLCIELGDASAEVHHCLGTALQSLKRSDEALVEFRAAVSLQPQYTRARISLGRLLNRFGRFVEAANVLHQGLALQPQNGQLHAHLAYTLGELGELDEVLSCLRAQLAMNPDAADVRSALLYTLHYHAASTPELLYREHVEWGKRYVDRLADARRPHGNQPNLDRRLKIGYVSPDFREHTVPRFIAPVIKNHDHDRFEVYCYSNSDRDDRTKARLRGWADHWREIRKLSDEDADRLIREDGIDILVDLRGHAADNRLLLFARKPAPVQAVMIGYFDTTGLPTIDYRLTDEQQDPTGESERYHVEALSRLPQTSWCYGADEEAPAVVDPPALTNGYVTFGSLNKIIKVTPECVRVWAAVLETEVRSRLMLVAPGRDSRQFVHDRLVRFGLPPDRIVLLDKAPTRQAYLDRFGQIDVSLDTYPFSGITTTCDGLWMGVPTVTLTGTTSVSRAGRSILSAIGLAELVASTPDQYVQAAASLARDLPRLKAVRAGMRQRMQDSPLMDHAGYTRRLESSFINMWSRWVATH
jgi:predicted O-linked N-acetylglucosamine transferase (SPINDLY family)